MIQATSGWRRMVPVALHGASRSTASNGGASKVSASATTTSELRRRRAKLAASSLSRSAERSTAVTISARRGEFGCFSARRRAEVDDPHAGSRPEEPRRQRGGGVLHPPFAVRVAFEFRDRRVGVEAHRAGRQHQSAKPLRPTRGIALDAEVERRLRAVRQARWRARRSRHRSSANAGRARRACRPPGDRSWPESPRGRGRWRGARRWRARRMGRWPARRASP